MGMNKTIDTVVIDGVTYEVPSNGNPNGVKFERSYECAICGLEYRRSDIWFFRGTPYGVPCGCSKDIPSIIKSEDPVRIPEDELNRGDR
jgi:hypothetical protein